LSERPVHRQPRRLVDWLKPTGAKKVHSLVDKVYQRENLAMAWEQCERTGVVAVWMGKIWIALPRNWISN
jgi:hypothetical protein